MTRRTAVVIGGGISGLAAAWELSADPDVDIEVLEASDRIGGLIASSEFAGRIVDEGADAFLRRVPEALDLSTEVGLGDRLIHPATGAALIYANGATRPLPGGLVLGVPARFDELAASGILSDDGVRRAAAEADRPWRPISADTSIASVIDDRYGPEVTRRLVEPLIGGIYAGNLDELSIDAVMPALAEQARGDRALSVALAEQLAQGVDGPVFAAPPDGMATLIHTLGRALGARGVRIRTGVKCDELPSADEIVLATPAAAAARLVATRSDRAATAMATIETAGVVMVTMSVPHDAIDGIDRASGVLVPRDADRFVTAASYATTKWPQLRRNDGLAILRVSSGHSRDQRALDFDDDEVVDRMVDDLRTIVEMSDGPADVRVSRYPGGFPQYRVGHASLVDDIDTALAEDSPSVVWCGASTRGPGIPACIRSGRRAARELRARR